MSVQKYKKSTKKELPILRIFLYKILWGIMNHPQPKPSPGLRMN